VSGSTATKAAASSLPVENVVLEESTSDDQTVIAAPRVTASSSNVHSKNGNVIGSHAADRALQKLIVSDPVSDQTNKVAIWSKKNMRWQDVGTLTEGYNIVFKEAADKWIGRGLAREATPEEVATYYGK
jgi:hypothetical protein